MPEADKPSSDPTPPGEPAANDQAADSPSAKANANADADAIVEQAQRFRQAYAAIRKQVREVIVGQAEVIDGVLTCLFVGGNCLLEGLPGLGKTLLIRTLSEAVSLKFGRIQFTPDLMPADITGTTVVAEAAGEDGTVRREFRFQRGPIFAQIILADEINRATPKTQSAMLEAMQERSVTVAGTTYPMEAPFFVLATQNPIEQEGTYPLPEAQLDRFFFKIDVGPASRRDLHEILNRTTGGYEPKVKAVLDGPAILGFQKLIRMAIISPAVQDFAIRCTLATHPEDEHASPMARQFVRIGASPRGAQTLVLAAKCRALLEGRAHASIDDIKTVALPALRHRLLLNFEGQAEGVTPDMVVKDILESTPTEPPRMPAPAKR